MNKIKKIKKIVNKQVEEYEKPAKLYEQDENFKRVVDYTNNYRKLKLSKNKILVVLNDFTSFTNKMLIQSLAERYKSMQIYVSFKKGGITEELKLDSNVKIIEFNSDYFSKLLASSKYVFTTVILPAYFIRKNNQILIQTSDEFSGQFDENDFYNPKKIRIQHSLFQASHLLLKSEDEAKKIGNLFNLNRIYKGKIHYKTNFYVQPETNTKQGGNILILNKKYSDTQLEHILKLANTEFGNFKIICDSSNYNYYSKKEGVRYQLIPKEVQKENLDLPNSILISDTETDLIGRKNIHFIIKDDSLIEAYNIDTLHYEKDFTRIFNIIEENDKDYITLYNNKPNIIMYSGGFLPNGITSSAINLSNSIDYDKYNLIIVDKSNLDETVKQNMNRLNPNANLIFRVGQSDITFNEYRKNQFIISRRGYRNYLGKKELKEFYNRELTRILGDINLEVAVDFSGYVPFWTAMFAFANVRKKVVYQHNDLLAETNKQINGKFKHKYILPRVFSLYKFFDKIVSVSFQTKELNAKNLMEFAPYSKFDFVNNVIDFNDILLKVEETKKETINIGENERVEIIKKLNNAAIVEFITDEEKTLTLTTIGRLSPEKDHHKLFHSIKQICEQYPNLNVQLNVLGSGILLDDLKKLISQLDMESNIHMLGQVNNPYAYLSKSDCFILSSNHEGQPMVLLEALSLGKKIIATDITGNRSVLEGTNGLLVDNSITGLVMGINKLINGNIKDNKNFDIHKYNAEAINMFYEKVCK